MLTLIAVEAGDSGVMKRFVSGVIGEGMSCMKEIKAVYSGYTYVPDPDGIASGLCECVSFRCVSGRGYTMMYCADDPRIITFGRHHGGPA